MVTFNFSPEWFYGIDSVFEIVSLLITILIAVYAYKLYRFSGNRNYKFFSLAFLLISLSFVFKIITNIIVYSQALEKIDLGTVTIIRSTITQYEFVYILGFLGFRMLTLLGLIGIYMVSYKNTSTNDMIIYGLLFFILCVFSHYAFIVFHMMALILLIFIVLFYYKNYLKKRSSLALMTLISFFMLMVSQILFTMTYIDKIYYAIAEVIQLIGFLVLMLLYMWVVRK